VHGQTGRPPVGPPPPGQIFDRLRESTTRPIPNPLPPSTPAPDMLWVPDRDRMVPGIETSVRVPGHWERRLPDGQIYVPPLVGIAPDGRTVQIPAGVRSPDDRPPTP
jgi:hypothetical protein